MSINSTLHKGDNAMRCERRERYEVGDVVKLFPDPTHEGPHYDDQFAHEPKVTILEVHTYLPPQVRDHIDEFTADEIRYLTHIEGYTVVERDMYGREEYKVKPGKVRYAIVEEN